jgi:methylmalonyl-CoA mutase N-terminal domain/subunit
MDETLALPSEKAARIALRTQQIIAFESGAANTVDPLGGSWFVEALTDWMETEAEKIFAEIDERGGVLECIEQGYFQREIAKSAYAHQQELESKQRVIVGVNGYVLEDEEIDIPVLRIDRQVEKDQCAFVQKTRSERDKAAAERTLARLKEVAAGDGNTFEAILDCSRAYVSVGEMCDVLREVWGEYQESAAAMQVS